MGIVLPPPPISVPAAPDFDDNVRACVEKWVNERAGYIYPTTDREPWFVETPTAEPFKYHRDRRVRVVDTTNALKAGYDLFLLEGWADGPDEDGWCKVTIPQNGTFMLHQSEVKFL